MNRMGEAITKGRKAFFSDLVETRRDEAPHLMGDHREGEGEAPRSCEIRMRVKNYLLRGREDCRVGVRIALITRRICLDRCQQEAQHVFSKEIGSCHDDEQHASCR